MKKQRKHSLMHDHYANDNHIASGDFYEVWSRNKPKETDISMYNELFLLTPLKRYFFHSFETQKVVL